MNGENKARVSRNPPTCQIDGVSMVNLPQLSVDGFHPNLLRPPRPYKRRPSSQRSTSLQKKMEEELRRRTFTEAPSFGRIGDTVSDPPIAELEVTGDDDVPRLNDFEFSFKLSESDPGTLTKTIAGEIFSNGRVLPVYPVFNRNLVASSFESTLDQELVEKMGHLALPFEKHDLRSGSVSSSSSISSEVDDTAAYCAWTPRSAPQSPDRWRMSQSTGSAMSEFQRFRLRDLFVGRSQSDGKEKLIAFRVSEKEKERGRFRPTPSHRALTEAEKKTKNGMGKGKGKDGEMKEMDVVTAHRIYYGKGGAVARRSFLPYRPGLLGFGNGKRPQF